LTPSSPVFLGADAGGSHTTVVLGSPAQILGRGRLSTVDLDATAPVPLSNRREFRNGRPSLRPNQFGIHQRKKSSPAERRRRQSAISRARVEPDRPKFVVMRLAHFHFRHPIKDFARIEIAEDSLFELEEKRGMERIAQVQERVRAGQSIQ